MITLADIDELKEEAREIEEETPSDEKDEDEKKKKSLRKLMIQKKTKRYLVLGKLEVTKNLVISPFATLIGILHRLLFVFLVHHFLSFISLCRSVFLDLDHEAPVETANSNTLQLIFHFFAP